MNVRSSTINGFEQAYLEFGSGDGPLALLVHGFPDTPHTWRRQREALAGIGYRVVTPFFRGYAPSGFPPDGNYQTGSLAADAIAWHEQLGGDERAVIVGHDYGASAAYGAAAYAPERWRRVVALSVPPRRSYLDRGLAYDQLRRSWYMWFFQMDVAQKAVGANDLEFLERLWRDWSPSYDPREDLSGVRAALGSPAHLAAALEYYRFTFGRRSHDDALASYQRAVGAPTPRPVLYIHGVDDGCVGIELTEGVEASFEEPGSRVVRVPGAGHFVHLERPDIVNAHLIEFLSSS